MVCPVNGIANKGVEHELGIGNGRNGHGNGTNDRESDTKRTLMTLIHKCSRLSHCP